MPSTFRHYSQSATVALLVLLLIGHAGPESAAHAHKPKRNSTALLTASGVHGTVVPVHPLAWNSFPNAQSSAACAIISINGLGWLDGDYTLANAAQWSAEKPTWIHLMPKRPHTLTLSWVTPNGVWGIYFVNDHSGDVLYGAFLPPDSDVSSTNDMPPAHSSRWMTFNNKTSRFEEVDHNVSISCQACGAASVSGLRDNLSACNGPYRLQRTGGVFVWSHVIDHRCKLLHDNVGNALVMQSSSAVLEEAIDLEVLWSAAGGETTQTNGHSSFRPGWWTHLSDESKTWQKQGGIVAECTSAGATTRLSFNLSSGSPAGTGGSRGATRTDAYITDGCVSTQIEKYAFSTTHDGAVISVAQGNVHLRISLDQETSVTAGTAGNVAVSQETLHHYTRNAFRSLNVKIIVNREIYVTLTLQTLTKEGVLLQMPDGVEGTHVIELWLLEENGGSSEPDASAHPIEERRCLAQGVLIFEVFPEETYVLQRRSLTTGAVSSGTVTGNFGSLRKSAKTRVVLLSDLKVVDGYKLSTFHLARHLPDNIQASVLDLSCEDGDFVMKEMHEREVGHVTRFCIVLEAETWEKAGQENEDIGNQLYTIFSDVIEWTEVVETHPDIARAFNDVYSYLKEFDTIVISNGGKDGDGYLLHLARLAGVRGRVVNIGSRAGGYVSPLFDAATSLVGPSHYVAHRSANIRNARGLPIRICSPIMDASRILRAARACPVSFSRSEGSATSYGMVAGTSEESANNTKATSGYSEDYNSRRTSGLSESNPGLGSAQSGFSPDGASRAGRTNFESHRFVMVSRINREKSPGVFVRAIGALQRRQLSDQMPQLMEGVLIGTGKLREPMERLAGEVGAEIHFTGFLAIDVVPCEVVRATALVLPSFALETFGMVAPEAMILGVPVVTFGYGGTGELVRHMENGIIVSEPTPTALADALELLARDSILRDRLGAQARLDALRALSLPELVACHTDAFL